MKILISTWGNPKAWGKVKYCYKRENRESKDALQLIREKEKIEKTIIVSIDTLADECISPSSTISYRDIRDHSHSLIEDFCKKEVGYQPDKIIISYGVGKFNNLKFIGNAMDFYYYVFKELSFTLLEWLKNYSLQNENRIYLDIYLDISHGINFLPVLTYRALKEILQILAYICEIRFIVLNSDTYIRAEKSDTLNTPNTLNINVIEESKILPKIIAYKISKRPIEPSSAPNSEEKEKKKEKENEKEKIGKIISEVLGSKNIAQEILYFLSAFMYALPLFVITYLPDKEELEKEIEKIIKEFENNIEIKTKNNKKEITRNIEFTINFENLIKAYLLSWLLNKKGFYKKDEIELEEIKKIKEIWKENFPVESNRIDVEINDIKELFSSLPQDYKTYLEIKKKSSDSNNIDKRNFFAHAGFEHNIIEMKKENQKIKLRINSKLEEMVKNYLEDNLPGG
ncbi:MAG: CRISPR-associated CARF protein Csx1 [candidate division WOR-3 bacterium]